MGIGAIEVADAGVADVLLDICPKAARLTAHKIDAKRALR
jgi:hypothetical protein